MYSMTMVAYHLHECYRSHIDFSIRNEKIVFPLHCIMCIVFKKWTNNIYAKCVSTGVLKLRK